MFWKAEILLFLKRSILVTFRTRRASKNPTKVGKVVLQPEPIPPPPTEIELPETRKVEISWIHHLASQIRTTMLICVKFGRQWSII